MNKKGDEKQLIIESISTFKKGLAYQREKFKAGKDGTGNNNFDLMSDSIENLKSDLKSRIIKQANKKIVVRIEKIIDWYRTKEERHTKRTPEGLKIIFPPGLPNKINKNLTIAYELLIEQMDALDLL